MTVHWPTPVIVNVAPVFVHEPDEAYVTELPDAPPVAMVVAWRFVPETTAEDMVAMDEAVRA